jgi:ATP-dependent protease ClpP protease subunit
MGAIGVHHTATVDEPWDANAAVSAMPNDAAVLRYCFGWYEGSEPDQKGSYKFPHHKTKGGPANLPACRNGLARLEGSNIPEGDKAGVRSHLNAHLNDAKSKDLASALPSVMPGHRDRVDTVMNRVKRKWYDIRNSTAPTAEIYIYDEIGFCGVTAASFVEQLNEVTSPSIDLHINSPGGEVFDGIAIHSALTQHSATVNVMIDGLAASIASVIAMAGDTITIAPSGMMMIHEASGACLGAAADMRKMADVLDKCTAVVATAYAGRGGSDADAWRELMAAETWYTGEEAVAAGLADRLAGVDPVAPEGIDVTASAAQWAEALRMYRYAGRDAAPAPTGPRPTFDLRSLFKEAFGRVPSPQPVSVAARDAALDSTYDPELFRRALKEALSE